MKVLACDIASQTGWAVGSTESKTVQFGSIRFGRDGATLVERAHGLWVWLDQMFAAHRPGLFVFETPILPHAGWNKRKGRITQGTNLATVRTLSGMALVAELSAAVHRIECAEADAPRWRRYFLGNVPVGREPIARATFDMCKIRGWNPTDGDQAAALGILDFALSAESPARAVRVTPMFSAAEEDQGRCRLQQQTVKTNDGRSRRSSSTVCRGHSKQS